MKTKKFKDYSIKFNIGDTLQDKGGCIYKIIEFKKCNNYNLGNSDADSLIRLKKIKNMNNTHLEHDVSEIFLSNFISDGYAWFI